MLNYLNIILEFLKWLIIIRQFKKLTYLFIIPQIKILKKLNKTKYYKAVDALGNMIYYSFAFLFEFKLLYEETWGFNPTQYVEKSELSMKIGHRYN